MSKRRDLERTAATLAAHRASLGIIRTEEWNGLVPGSHVRLRGQGTGERILIFRAHYTSTRRGTEWVDCWDATERVIRPVRPEFVIKCRKQPVLDQRKRAESPAAVTQEAS